MDGMRAILSAVDSPCVSIRCHTMGASPWPSPNIQNPGICNRFTYDHRRLLHAYCDTSLSANPVLSDLARLRIALTWNLLARVVTDSCHFSDSN